MKYSKYYCPWCEGAKLEFRDVMYDASNGPCAVSNQGIVLGCSLAQVTNCPDTTAACRTEDEAEGYAREMCKTYPTFSSTQDNQYTSAYILYTGKD